jgi:hypothetical protein
MKFKSNEIIIKAKIKLENQSSYFTRVTFEMPHKFIFIYFLNENFTTSTYTIFASTLKISAQYFNFRPLIKGVKDC